MVAIWLVPSASFANCTAIHDVTWSVQVGCDLHTLDCFCGLVEGNRHGVIWLHVIDDEKLDQARCRARTELHVSLLESLLKFCPIWWHVGVSEGGHLLSVFLVLFLLVLDHLLFQATAPASGMGLTGLRGRRGVQRCLLWFAVRSHVNLEGLLLLDLALETDRVLLSPRVRGESFLVPSRSFLHLGQALLQFGILGCGRSPCE